jgi:hypothetical protein
LSRWFITSSDSANREARAASRKSHLHPSGQLTGPGLFGEAYFKRVLATQNVFQCGDDWVCSAGTIIYHGQLGEAALRNSYADFISGGVRAVQQKALGHYALAIKHGSNLIIFTDPQGALNLYYLRNEQFWIVSNSLSTCAASAPDHTIDETKLLISAVQSTLPGEDTFYSGIKRLFGTQQIRVDLRSGAFRVDRLPELSNSLDWKLPTIEDALSQYVNEVRAVFHNLSAVGTMGILATGGLDSRTILSAVLDQGAPVQLMYGMGNSKLTDYDNDDLKVVQQIAQRYNLPFQQLDWSGNQPYEDRKLQELFRVYGFKYEIYGASESFLRTFNGEIFSYPQLFMGGYSPAFTNGKPWEWERKTYYFEDLIRTAMQSLKGPIENSQCITNVESYKTEFSREVRIALDRAGIDIPETGVPLETFVKAKLFLYLRAESRFLNFANEFGHYIAPFLMKRLYDPLLNVPFEYRSRDEFQIRLIQSLAPGLVEIPLFSGWSRAHIDPATLRLVRDYNSSPPPSVARRVASKVLPYTVKKGVRKIYSNLTGAGMPKPAVQSPRDSRIVDVYGQAVMHDPLGQRWFRSIADFSPKELTRIRHYLMAVNSLGYRQ